jgi:hypothetical protein
MKYRVVTVSGKYKGSYLDESRRTKYFDKQTAEKVARQLSQDKKIGKSIIVPVKKKPVSSYSGVFGPMPKFRI